jgi:hypothetical protein
MPALGAFFDADSSRHSTYLIGVISKYINPQRSFYQTLIVSILICTDPWAERKKAHDGVKFIYY